MSEHHPRSSLSARATSLEGGLNHSPRPSTIAHPVPTQPAPGMGATPALWFSAPDLRLARAAEAELVEPESQAQQRARAKFFDEVTSTDLRRWWYPVSVSEDLGKETVVGMTLLGDPIVLWRDREGTAVCLEDKCAHRSTPLSLGRIRNGELECAYDGWRYDSEGNVTHIPALLPDRDIPTNACARRYPTVERDGLLWVWPGDPTLPAYDIHARLPPILSPGSQSTMTAAAPSVPTGVARVTDESDEEQTDRKESEGPDGGVAEGGEDHWGKVFTSVTDLDVDQSVFVECFLDFPHLAYSQPSHLITHPPHPVPTPVQVEIKFAVESPGVMATINRPETKDAPVEVRFIPPCHVQISSNVNGYKFNQTIHCVPTRPGQSRIIYRHSRNYWNWIDWMPFVGSFYNSSWAKRLMSEYAVLKGMQDRLRYGAKPWNAPIQADLLPRYYREWYKRCMVKHNPFFSTFAPVPTGPGAPQATFMNPYGVPSARPFTISAPPRYTLAHIPHPTPSQLGIIQAASAAAATAAVQASAGASRRGSIANLVGVGGLGGGSTGSRRGSMIIMPPVSAPPHSNAPARGTSVVG
ncbi:hypothetical protein PhCBS80983_g05318 [Powellomyces hirtus]|uniref:Rieske domain-containing protein n=1 Tax=Powellomyces hirtus TaxID=109895 RepID=A0A507DVW4_9FUNG|nr:hypothetical protein PhCBS80983_g05318 [Powellomyces hirtus]